MSTSDFIALTDIAFENVPKDAGAAPTVRDATQADIDMLLG